MCVFSYVHTRALIVTKICYKPTPAKPLRLVPPLELETNKAPESVEREGWRAAGSGLFGT